VNAMSKSISVKVSREALNRATRQALRDSTVRVKMTAGQRRAVKAAQERRAAEARAAGSPS
jgi:hypothetical protein